MQGLPAIPVTRNRRGLLPHVFTLIPVEPGQLFSVALSVPARRRDPALHRYTALRCPDFPPPLGSDSLADSSSKGSYDLRFGIHDFAYLENLIHIPLRRTGRLLVSCRINRKSQFSLSIHRSPAPIHRVSTCIPLFTIDLRNSRP